MSAGGSPTDREQILGVSTSSAPAAAESAAGENASTTNSTAGMPRPDPIISDNVSLASESVQGRMSKSNSRPGTGSAASPAISNATQRERVVFVHSADKEDTETGTAVGEGDAATQDGGDVTNEGGKPPFSPGSPLGSRRTSVAGDVGSLQEAPDRRTSTGSTGVGNEDSKSMGSRRSSMLDDLANSMKMTSKEQIERSLSRGAKEAEEESVRHRSEKFISYNPWQHDASFMAAIDGGTEGVELKPSETEEMQLIRQNLKRHEADNNTALKHFDCVGFNFDEKVRGNGTVTLAHSEDDAIVYGCGRHITLTGLVDPTRKMLLRQESVISVSAFTVSSNGKYVAVAERRTDAYCVTIYKIDSSAKVTTLNLKFLSKTPVIALHFSSNNRYLATISAGPDHKLLMWQLDDVKIIGMSELNPKVPITSVSVNPWESMQLCTSGPKTFQLWRLIDKTLTPSEPLKSCKRSVWSPAQNALATIVAHCWYDEECCAVLTQEGWLLAVEAFDVKCSIKLSHPAEGKLPSHRDAILRHDFASYKYQPSATPSPSILGGRSLNPSPSNAAATPSASLRGAPSPNSFNLAGGWGDLALEATVTSYANPQEEDPAIVLGTSHRKFVAMAWASRGLVIASADGMLLIVDRDFSDSVFTQAAVMWTHSDANVLGISVSPAEVNIAVALANNSIEYVLLEEVNDTLDEVEQSIALAEGRIEEYHNEGSSDDDGHHPHDNKTSNSSKLAPPGLRTKRRSTVVPSDDGHGDSRRPSRTEQQLEADEKFIADSTGPYGTVVPGDIFIPISHVGFHSDLVTSISLAMQRPLIATTSLDSTVRLYDYEKHLTIVTKKMDDAIIGGAVHPSGLHIVLVFRFFTRVYAIIPGDIHFLQDLGIKGVNSVKFSSQGGRLCFSMQHRVLLYNAHSFQFEGMLMGHNAMIKSVDWSENDTIITTCDVTGLILMWNAETRARLGNDSSHKNLIFQSALHHTPTGLLAAVGCNKHARGRVFEGEFTITCCTPGNNEETLIYVRPGMILPKSLANRKVQTGLLAIANLSSTLFVGTPTGRILLFTWPLVRASKPYSHLDSHNSEILHLFLTPEEKYLVSVSADHTMYIYSVQQIKAGRYVNLKSFDYSIFDPVKYSTSTDLDDRDREMADIKDKIDERTRDNEQSRLVLVKMKELEYKEMVQQNEQLLEKMRKKIDQTNAERALIEGKETKKLTSIESQHVHIQEEIEQLYNKRAMEKEAQLAQIESERDELVIAYEKKVAERLSEGEKKKQQLEATRKENERNLAAKLEEAKKESKSKMTKYDAMLCQTAVDYETQLVDIARSHERNIRSNEEKVSKAATNASAGDREAERHKREKYFVQEQLDERAVIIKDLDGQCKRKLAENEQLKVDMLARQEAINVAERKMQHLKHQLTILDNLRFVLSHQFEELRGDVLPKDLKVKKLDLIIVERESELQVLSHERANVKSQVAAVAEKIQAVEKEKAKMNVLVLDQVRVASNLTGDIERCVVDYKSDDAAFKTKLSGLVKKGMANFKSASKEVDAAAAALQEELLRHDEFLLAKHKYALGATKAKLVIGDKRHHEMLTQNSDLVKEIQALRHEQRQLHTHCSVSEVHLRDTRVALQRLASSDPQLLLEGRDSPRRADSPQRAIMPRKKKGGASSAPNAGVGKKRMMGPTGKKIATQGLARGLLPPLQRQTLVSEDVSDMAEISIVTTTTSVLPPTAGGSVGSGGALLTSGSSPMPGLPPPSSAEDPTLADASPKKKERARSVTEGKKFGPWSVANSGRTATPTASVEKPKGAVEKPQRRSMEKPQRDFAVAVGVGSRKNPKEKYQSPGSLLPAQDAAPRTQLEDLMTVLDANTERMEEQNHGIQFLKNFVQELLGAEERRLLSALKGVGNLNKSKSPSPSTAAGGTTRIGDGGVNLELVEDGDQATSADALLAGVRGSGATTNASTMFGGPTPGPDLDRTVTSSTTSTRAASSMARNNNEDSPEWKVEKGKGSTPPSKGRPMSPADSPSGH